MAQGRPSSWARLEVNQPLWLNKAGVSIVIWDKYGRKRKGTLVVSVGGLRWYPYMGKRARRITWDELASE